MEQGVISLDSVGPFDLQSTVESGQSYTWSREDGRMYDQTHTYGGSAWYSTVLPATMVGRPAVVRVRQHDGRLEWESTIDAYEPLVDLLRLDDDLEAIMGETADEPLIREAYEAYRGLRLVRDPPFSSLISFICSAQMRVSRIHDMQHSLARTFGDAVEFDGRTYHAFPTPKQLATATEAELRDLKLGYRAPYVVATAEMVANEELHPTDVLDMEYEQARERLTQFVGVGQKVADCVLLFSLDFLQAVPLDTWIRGAIADRFPGCDRDSYTDTSRAIRERFGPAYAGYAQTYVFHYLREAEPTDVSA
ncbi:DNA-3-methyladenine glycosylase family protein [Halocatena salina]|uniref:DNA-(apurinic or apyrimidinic site) lyase n=1 Tax=Halocatena salina TaxID=2934340 RepID=A0A8U0A179_9EURY|nr:DNA glycosylase [Halocatena salina]UPM42931.1 8-oxoguanine DNA glycosylase [Halocatena salina]